MDTLAQAARRVTLKELRLLLAVARSGSILKAASEIGMTQPALSKAIRELEASFGVRLFDRTNRGVSLTPHGDVLARRATGVFEELRQAVDELQSLTDADRGQPASAGRHAGDVRRPPAPRRGGRSAPPPTIQLRDHRA